jgi:hypothetical protein
VPLVPPTLVLTAPTPVLNNTILAISVFVENIWSTEIKYAEKRVIVKVVDE